MKRMIAFMIITVLAAAFLAGCSGGTDANVFSVHDVYDDPLAFTGEITIHGVVAWFAPGPGRFELADPTARPCCPANYILVEYDGALPEHGSEIHVTGSFVAEAGGPVFRATEVRRAG